MTIHTYGDKYNPTVLILPPMLSDAEYMEKRFSFLEERYFLVIPDYDGYGTEVNHDFTSAEEEANDILRCSLKKNYLPFAFVYAASLGARIFMELIKDNRFFFESCILDGLCLYEDEAEARDYLDRFFLSEREKARASFKYGKDFIASFYGETDSSRLADLFMRMSEKTILHSLISCTKYHFTDIAKSIQEKMTLFYGSKEDDYGPVTETFKERYPEVLLKVFEGYNHMELLRSDKLRETILAYLDQE